MTLKRGKNQLYWLNQFFDLLAASTQKIGSTLNERFMWAMKKLPQKEYDEIMEEKNKLEQQKKGFMAIPKKCLTGTMPAAYLLTGQYTISEKAKEKLIDVKFKFALGDESAISR